jgi:phage tail-like protein
VTRAEISRLLPLVLHRTLEPGSPLDAVLAVMEALHAPSEQILEDIDSIFDPIRTRPEFVPLLARWVDLAWTFDRQMLDPKVEGEKGPLSTGLGRLRELVSAAPHLAQWRGTRLGLVRFLETATGIKGFEIDDAPVEGAGRPRPFHLVVRAPHRAASYRELVRHIIEVEKPAYVTYDLQFVPDVDGSGTGAAERRHG